VSAESQRVAAGPGIAADSSARALTSQLGQVWDSLASLGAALSDSDWDAPTPCPGWRVSAQYAHVIGTESMLLNRPNPEIDPGRPEHVHNDIGGFNEVWVAALASETRESVLARLAEVTSARKKALAAMGEQDFSAPSWTPVGQADYRRFMQVRTFDCWVHEQDIRDAVGRPGHEDGPVAEQSVDEIVRALGYIVGKKAGAEPGSSLRITLTGPVRREVNAAVVDGRARVVEGLEGKPTASLAMSSTAFTRLACGRIAPATVMDGALGGVEMSGDAAFAQRIVDHLAFTI
jgi:uncharacterized protein (TIGR03083 family)